VVVTRDRRELLRRCLTALTTQVRPPDEILVVDNNSSDGTREMVSAAFPGVALCRLERNLGGAGGFHRGIAWAYAHGYDWLWLMDDDTIVRDDTLEALLGGAARAPDGPPLLVASQVRWKDERLHPMNAPVPRWRWRRELSQGIAHGLLLLRYVTFVSVAIHRSAVDRFGLPLEHYFIWGDDVEYTARVLRGETGYLVPESVAYHWTPSPHPAATPTSDRFYYHARNTLLLLRGSSMSPIERVDYGRYYLRTIRQYVRVNRRDRRRLGMLVRGVRDGMRGEAR
jgi:rhamnopyranosyl-N-acetylglucosaminyl-diphospho-decaprenol beta-1,3/1,4-galactofuranosyltransferase